MRGEVPVDDDTLMRRYASGDVAAFDALYARHAPALWQYCCGLDRASAQDLFQHVWLQVVQHRARYTGEQKFRQWLVVIARNRWTDTLRRLGRSPQRAADVEPAELRAPDREQPDIDAARSARLEAIQAALKALPDAQRDAWLQRAVIGCSLQDIADATGVGHETVKSRLRYARAHLSRQLGDHV